jgi:3-hydroxybutyryl-CoA dehydrogenase
MTSTPQAATDAQALLRGLYDDAIDMAVRSFASAADIDTAMRLGAGNPAGPFELRAHRPPSPEQRARLPAEMNKRPHPLRGSQHR